MVLRRSKKGVGIVEALVAAFKSFRMQRSESPILVIPSGAEDSI
jgi:hypothetical protein